MVVSFSYFTLKEEGTNKKDADHQPGSVSVQPHKAAPAPSETPLPDHRDTPYHSHKLRSRTPCHPYV